MSILFPTDSLTPTIDRPSLHVYFLSKRTSSQFFSTIKRNKRLILKKLLRVVEPDRISTEASLVTLFDMMLLQYH